MANCNTCGGKKKVKGIGMMNVICPDCKGTGTECKKAELVHVEKEPQEKEFIQDMKHDRKTKGSHLNVK